MRCAGTATGCVYVEIYTQQYDQLSPEYVLVFFFNDLSSFGIYCNRLLAVGLTGLWLSV